MLTCLLPLVALRGVEAQPRAALFVNDLPGVSAELADNLTDDDAATVADFWASIQRRASVRLVGMVERQLAEQKDWVRFLGETDRPEVYQPRTKIATSPGLYGVLLNVRDPLATNIFINGLAVFASGAALAVPLVAFELGDGLALDLETRDGQPATLPLTVDLRTGFNELDFGGLLLKPRYKEARIFVGLDLTGTLTPSLLSFVPPSDVPGLDFEAVRYGPGAATDAYGATYQTEQGHGVHPLLSVECSAEKIICRHARQFTEAWFNLLGAELLKEKIHSDRTNYFTLSNLALTQENAAFLMGQAATALNSVVRRLPASVACQVCDESTAGVVYDQNGGMP